VPGGPNGAAPIRLRRCEQIEVRCHPERSEGSPHLIFNKIPGCCPALSMTRPNFSHVLTCGVPLPCKSLPSLSFWLDFSVVSALKR
jgi:hypothetical protein